MAKVKLNLLNIFQLRINKKSINYEGKTVRDVISQFLSENREKLDVELLDKEMKRKIKTYLEKGEKVLLVPDYMVDDNE